ncbi:MAG: bifunctional 2-C-methyl-D-erythritol 4-phosphate cytidylyltransferase/2-C-methyl-D-erythritol 2,4-cyclodiphosphate synthase [Sulfurospirillaceae bacterium]|nr:bifunctional 2-C-methyl-D-erythritol 4-phosphate cytidylyltransferase/2-C-methyl-D-erythritol 2,4-cyclodiphosphate synthase [Sulfurospirillaceae bacterium]
MPDLTLVILGAGSSSRFKAHVKKQWLRIEDIPLWLYSTQQLLRYGPFAKVILTASPDEIAYARKFSDAITFVEGGQSRQASLHNALVHVNTPYVLVSDSARACIGEDMMSRILQAKGLYDCVVPYLPAIDTVIFNEKAINRDDVKLIQTPQLSRTALLKQALLSTVEYTDDSSAIQALGGSIGYVLGDVKAKKLTTQEDIAALPCLKAPLSTLFVGSGFDVHSYEEGKAMMLGGIEIHPNIGFRAHSDGDVAIHALIDALLGASGAGDIGEFFPDTDMRYKNIDSKTLLKEVCTFLQKVGFEIVHCDITIMAEFPRIGVHKETMRFCLATLLNIAPQHVNIKATTTEKLGFIGRKEGVGVSATATLKYYDWKNA